MADRDTQATNVELNQAWFTTYSGSEFVEGSPHLKHSDLHAYCRSLAAEAFRRVAGRKSVPAVLDMGAGDGMLAIPFLEMGATVTAADATAPLLEELRAKAEKYKDRLTLAPGDIFETIARCRERGQQFDIVSASSFFHHIPDYLGLCRMAAELIPAGGVFFAFQDPMRYDSLGRGTYFFDRLAYFGWRITQGDYLRGLRTRWRRMRGELRDDLPEDTAEYHVVRNGVDQDAIKQVLEECGLRCEIHRYWSTQGKLFQHLGVSLKLVNTFAVMAQKHAEETSRHA